MSNQKTQDKYSWEISWQEHYRQQIQSSRQHNYNQIIQNPEWVINQYQGTEQYLAQNIQANHSNEQLNTNYIRNLQYQLERIYYEMSQPRIKIKVKKRGHAPDWL